MLSYRHGFHAGNFADVLKHLVLVRALRYLVRKDKGLRYIDTHAGAGEYRLDAIEARRNNEHRQGIGLLWQQSGLPEPLADYLGLVREANENGVLRVYPGSPWLARRILRPHDRLELCELHPRDYPALESAFGHEHRTTCHRADGFAVSLGLMPPVERRGLVLIDPSYELKADYVGVVEHVRELHRRFATGVFMVWYPVVEGGGAERMARAFKRAAFARAERYELRLRPTVRGRELNLSGAGVVVVNPPFVLADEVAGAMRAFASLSEPSIAMTYHGETVVARTTG